MHHVQKGVTGPLASINQTRRKAFAETPPLIELAGIKSKVNCSTVCKLINGLRA